MKRDKKLEKGLNWTYCKNAQCIINVHGGILKLKPLTENYRACFSCIICSCAPMKWRAIMFQRYCSNYMGERLPAIQDIQDYMRKELL